MLGPRPRLRWPGLGRLLAVNAVALLCGLVWAPAAGADPVLLQSDPPPGVVALRTPNAITLSFSQPIEPSGSAVRIQRLDVDGRGVTTGPPSVSGGGATLAVAVDGDLAGGVYEVEWSVLGTDGHQIAGRLRFGVVGAGGAAPSGIERLGGAAGATSSSTDGLVPALLRWVGLLAAALMLGGWLLAGRARAAGTEPPQPWTARLAAAAWAVALVAAFQSAIVVAVAGAQPGFDAGLLTGTESGVLALVRVGGLALLGAGALRLRRPGLLGPAGALALATHALDGHTAANDRALASVESLVHVEAAAAWAGGLLVLVLWVSLGKAPVRPLVRAFAPVAGIAMVVLTVTGVLIAMREVDSWIFLRWSTYGQVVIVKSLLVICVLTLAGWITWHRRRVRIPSGSRSAPLLPRPLRVEAVAALSLLALAAVLAGLAPGRGQPKFAQRGNLLTGATLATVATVDGPLQLTVAPGRPGANTISAIPAALREGELPTQPGSIEVRLGCDCAEDDQRLQLRQGEHGVWSARVELPTEGTWFAYLRVSGQPATAPVPLAVNDGHEGGPDPFVVRVTADLTGAEAGRCRAFVQGLGMGVGRLNATGGVDGGRKVVLDVRDDGGNPTRAAQLARRDRPDVLTPCGPGGAGAIGAAGEALVLAGDPTTPSTAAPLAGTLAEIPGAATVSMDSPTEPCECNVFRLALDPYAEGVGIGRFLEQTGLKNPVGTPKRVAVVVHDAAGDQRLAGLQAEVAAHHVTVDRLPASAAESAASLKHITDPERYLATLLDGAATPVAAALRELGGDARSSSSMMFVAPRLATEPFMLAAGPLGRLGALRVLSEVLPDSADGLAYASAVGAIFRGEQARMSGLRGYVTGLTLAEAVRDGTGMSDMVGRLRRPPRFTDALTIPWLQDAPARGAQGFAIYAPNFLPANLTPESIGGMAYSGRFFQKGTWSRIAPSVYGPQIDVPELQPPSG